MTIMNPYDAHKSAVGPVFDVATWSSRKVLTMAIVGLAFGLAIATVTTWALVPDLLFEKPPQILKTATAELAQLKKEHMTWTYVVITLVGLFGLLCICGGSAYAVDAFRSDYYFRAGPGGIAFRVPGGLDVSKLCLVSKKLERDISHADIRDWKITHRKQAGSLSRDAGNISAAITIKTTGGETHFFSLDYFREPARIISRKIEDALEMVPYDFGQSDLASSGLDVTVEGIEKKLAVIAQALDQLLAGGGDSAVTITDPSSGKFVQFASVDGNLLFDLPAQTLNDVEMLRAEDLFRKIGEEIQQYDLVDAPGGAAVGTQRSFQLDLAHDSQTGAKLAIGVFANVYHVPEDSPVEVELT